MEIAGTLGRETQQNNDSSLYHTHAAHYASYSQLTRLWPVISEHLSIITVTGILIVCLVVIFFQPLMHSEHLANQQQQERERNVLFNDALNTFYLRLHGVRHMVKDHSDSEKGNPLPPHRLLLSISSKGSFICTIPQTG